MWVLVFLHIDILMTSEQEFSNLSSLVFNHFGEVGIGFFIFYFLRRKEIVFFFLLSRINKYFWLFNEGFKVSFDSFLVNQKIEEILWFYNFFFHFPKFVFLTILEYEFYIFFLASPFAQLFYFSNNSYATKTFIFLFKIWDFETSISLL